MSVLDNIMVGRHHLLKNNFLTGALYWIGGAEKEKVEPHRNAGEAIAFLDNHNLAKAAAGPRPARPLLRTMAKPRRSCCCGWAPDAYSTEVPVWI